MEFNPGFEIKATRSPLGFQYGENVFGPSPEVRRLADIRASLADPAAQGPEELYGIVMDVGREEDRAAMMKRNLLFGAVTYAAGLVGREPVRSQGHIHAVSLSCGSSTPEVYEIWEGEAVIYMQPGGGDNPGRCYAVHAGPGQVVIVPPGWVHATVNGDVTRPMTFGAWCVRDYGFEYKEVRAHGGIAYFPVMKEERLCWEANPAYAGGELIVKRARGYGDFGLTPGEPVYSQFAKEPDCFLFVARPMDYPELWKGYEP